MQITNIIKALQLFLPLFIQLNKKELEDREGIVFAIQKRSKTGKSVLSLYWSDLLAQRIRC